MDPESWVVLFGTFRPPEFQASKGPQKLSGPLHLPKPLVRYSGPPGTPNWGNGGEFWGAEIWQLGKGSPYAPCTWNLFVLYFGGWTLQNKVFSNQNKGHLGSRYGIFPYIVP